jgi:hypothetical protein
MQPLGRVVRYDIDQFMSFQYVKYNEGHAVDINWLLDGLADGSVTIYKHDERVDAHLLAVNARMEKLKRAEAEYVKRSQRGLE